MKKLAIALLTAMLACSVLAQETEFPDIPDNHWAASAVSEIADLGIVIGFPDGTFRGNTAFTRYQAALVISRTLDVLEANIEAATAMTDEDIASLRNALQELASDVASQGVRLAAAESAIASISDDVIANSARLDELEAGVGTGTGNGDPAVLRDLQNQIASQRVALDTAQAQAEAAEALANDALDAANAAASRARQNADEISALNQLVQDLSDRFDELAIQSGRSDLATGVTDRIARTEADIANIREFVILLRRDQVALRDRVAAIEAADADQAAAVADLEERVAAIENNPLGLSGSISASLRVERLSGANEAFDVDRAFGLGLPAEMDASVFSTGNGDEDGDGKVEDIAGERAQDRADIDGVGTNGVSTDLSLSIDNAFGLAGTGAFNDFGIVVNFELNEITAEGPDNGTTDDVTFYAFQLKDFTVTFDPIGGDALSFQFGEAITAEFTPYVLDIDAADSMGGFVATIGSPDMLAFLDPTFQVVYGNPAAGEFLRGVRTTVTPLDGFFLGGSFVQHATGATDKDDVNDDNVTTTVWGVDAALGLSIFEIAGEYATASQLNAATDATTDFGDVFYVVVDVDGLPFLRDVSANYRDVDDAWDNQSDILTGDAGDYPFVADQTGFGVSAGFDLFILGVDGYFDSYSTTNPAADVTAFGVDVTAPLFSGFALTGYYHSASINGTTVDDLSTGMDANEAVVVAGVDRNDNYATEFGVALAHDGTADNALIAGLDLAFGYEQSEADFSVTTLSASADYDLNVSIAALTPYVSYTSTSDVDANADDTTTLAVGTGLSTQPLGVIFAPSLEAAVNYRTTDHTMSDAAGDEYTATEMQWSVGLALNEFLFDNSTLAARYGSYTGTNVSVADLGGEGATDISAGDADNGLTQTVSGYELAWMYYGLEVAYGVYESDEGTGAGSTAGQVFAINYSVNF